MAPEFALALTGFAGLMALIILRAPIALAMLIAGAAGYVHILDQAALFNYLKTTPYHLFAGPPLRPPGALCCACHAVVARCVALLFA
jgi:hypothetical protein